MYPLPPPEGDDPVNIAGKFPEQMNCDKLIVLELINGITVISIAEEVSIQVAVVTILLYHVVTVKAIGEKIDDVAPVIILYPETLSVVLFSHWYA